MQITRRTRQLRYNVLQLPEGGDFEALHCQPSTNFARSAKLDLTTEPPLLGRCCCAFGFYLISLSFLKASFVEFNRITGNSSIFVSSFPIFVAKK